ncbi:Putative invertase inhibitor [Apostasia shenzhenica]|uniref:Invertase inhibitor n=1 Tax=Apostasia shenzhenica TaxID=1088818 RepID=A0A2I0ACM7_9ASPA|nr:Putative invertase inhibitor [Apostasia shenzhenica]
MNPPPFLLPSLLLLLAAAAAAPHLAGADTLHETCNFLGGDYINYDYCVSTLSSDPAIATADNHGLAVISINLTATNATALRSRADGLAQADPDSFVRAQLRNCSALYAAALPDIRKSADAAADRNYGGATEMLAGVLRVPAGCDEAFKSREGVVSPIRRENDEFSDLASLAKAVNNYMSR